MEQMKTGRSRFFFCDSFSQESQQKLGDPKEPQFTGKMKKFQKPIRIGSLVLWTCQHLGMEKQMVEGQENWDLEHREAS